VTPAWLTELAARAGEMSVPARLRAPAHGGRSSAVLLLFGETAGAPDLLIVQRGPHLRRHAGQPAFPGGAIEPADQGPVGAALREAAEEVGVDPAGVEVLAVLPELYIPRSGFRVTPVLAWWRAPSPLVAAADGEIVSAARARLTDLADPANRLSVRHPSGAAGPAFRVLHRAARGPPARARRVGAAVGHRAARGPAAGGPRRRRAQLATRRRPAAPLALSRCARRPS
jgi:8-oxo-dGTP pyrophosphatase MutT (NUDIX family)